MFFPAQKYNHTVRRMKPEDLIAKLEQIEEQASRTMEEYPRGLTLERQRLILGLARQMRRHLQDESKNGRRTLHSVTGERPSAANGLSSDDVTTACAPLRAVRDQ
jgi:hypothetical protein